MRSCNGLICLSIHVVQQYAPQDHNTECWPVSRTRNEMGRIDVRAVCVRLGSPLGPSCLFFDVWQNRQWQTNSSLASFFGSRGLNWISGPPPLSHQVHVFGDAYVIWSEASMRHADNSSVHNRSGMAAHVRGLSIPCCDGTCGTR